VSQTQPGGARRLVDLPVRECWRLVASRPVGRLAWCTPHGPTLVPVTFTVSPPSGPDEASGVVHVRTSAYSAVVRECDDSTVAFEVDEIDEAARSGWSVLLRGRASLRYGGALGPGDPAPWAAGARSLGLDIDVGEISGRRLAAET
jgi:hypothetical protein